MNRVVAVVRKEWEEVFRQRLVLGTVAFVPLLLTGLGLATVGTTSGLLAGDSEAQKLADPEMIALMGKACTGLTVAACTQSYLATLYLLLLLVMPLVIPSTFAAYSIVGEKAARTLEPLLATPITTPELLLAKVLAAVLPAVLVTWGAVGVYVFGCFFLVDPTVFPTLVAPQWVGAHLVLGPLLAIFSALVAVMVSSRSTDPRVAQQVAGLVVLPVIAMLVGQSLGLVLVDPSLVAIGSGVAVLLDLGLGWLSVQLFEREVILTRWR